MQKFLCYCERCLTMLFFCSWTWRLWSCWTCAWAGVWVQVCSHPDWRDGTSHFWEVEGMQVLDLPVYANQLLALIFLWQNVLRCCWCFFGPVQKRNSNMVLSYFVRGCNVQNWTFSKVWVKWWGADSWNVIIFQQWFQIKTFKSDIDVQSKQVSAAFGFFTNLQEILFPIYWVLLSVFFQASYLTAKRLFQGSNTSTGWN